MSKRYPGVREIVKGRKYEIGFQINSQRKQYRVNAASEKEAYLKKAADMAEFQQKMSVPEEHRERLTVCFEEVWKKLYPDILADKVSRKMEGKYKNTFQRMFVDLRNRSFSYVLSPTDLNLSFFKEYKAYYVNDLNHPGGWRAELTIVKALMKRIYQLGYCGEDLIKQLNELKKPKANKKEYPDISKSSMEKLITFIRQDRPDYYGPIYFMYRTARRREETMTIEKKDVVLRGFKPVAINIRAETTKTGEKAPLNCLDEELERHIRGALSNNKTKWLFPNKLGNKCTSDKVYVYLKKVSREIIGVEITPHYFRHRFFTECGKANVPLADVKAISGIKSTKVLLEYYSHSTVEGQKQVLAITR